MHHRNITPLGPDELDAFTIQSQYEKLKKNTPLFNQWFLDLTITV